MMKSLPIFSLLIALGLVPMHVHALMIDLSFGAGFTGSENTVKRGVANAAAKWWENSILTDFTVSVTVQETDLSAEGAGPLGRMHSNFQTAMANPITNTKLPSSGFVELTTASSIDFFFDPTPHKNEEFNMTQRSGLVGMAKPGGAADGLYDALAILTHEFGHVLGFSGGSGFWSDGEDFNSYDAWADNMIGRTFEFDWLMNGKEGNKTGLGGAQNTVDMGGVSGFHILESDIIALMNPNFSLGERRLQTPIDIDMIGDAFHLSINDIPLHVPEPSAVFLLGFGLMGLILKKKMLPHSCISRVRTEQGVKKQSVRSRKVAFFS